MFLHVDYMPHAVLHEFCQDHGSSVTFEMFIVVFKHELVDIDFANAMSNTLLCKLIFKAIGAMQDNSHTAIDLLVDCSKSLSYSSQSITF